MRAYFRYRRSAATKRIARPQSVVQGGTSKNANLIVRFARGSGLSFSRPVTPSTNVTGRKNAALIVVVEEDSAQTRGPLLRFSSWLARSNYKPANRQASVKA